MDSILLNGAARDVRRGETVQDLVASLGLDARWVLAELNGSPLPRSEFESAVLSPGDRLELVRPVAGG
jgi:thiamine biosynthesis protein ThiS